MTLIPDYLHLAEWTKTMRRSVMREMIQVIARPGVLSLAGGLPAVELFPVEELSELAAKVLLADPRALQYGPPVRPLLDHITTLMAMRGVTVSPEQIYLTTGAQQGLDIIARILMEPGREVMLEEITYTGAQLVVQPYSPRILPIPVDTQDGMDVDAVERMLQAGHKPAYLYTVTDGHNPLGVSLSTEKRERLAAIARHYGLPLVEDDPYGLLHYDEVMLPPIRALDDQWVFYVGSFSKILAPALRLGWLVVPPTLVNALTVVKESIDLESSQLMQRLAAAYLESGEMPNRLERLRAVYRRRRDVMLAALADHFPEEARWSRPSAGMFVWVELPEKVNTKAMLETAVSQEKVAYIPGYAFAVDGRQAMNCLRLNFTTSTEAQIETAVARLGRVIKRELAGS